MSQQQYEAKAFCRRAALTRPFTTMFLLLRWTPFLFYVGSTADAEAEQGHPPLVDKTENPWTISVKFKHDIVNFFATELREYRQKFLESHDNHYDPNAGGRPPDAEDASDSKKSATKECQIGIELGAHVGLTTGFLAQHCHQVWALENSIAVLEQNMANNQAHDNIAYFEFHSVLDDWEVKLPKNHLLSDSVSFVLVDAAHDVASVLNDLEQAAKLAPFLVLDDYGAEQGVREAVEIFVEQRKKAKRVRYLGHTPPWTFEDRTITAGPEGLLLQVTDFVTVEQKRCLLGFAEGQDEHQGHDQVYARARKCRVPVEQTASVVQQQVTLAVGKVWDTTWYLYPTGVFLSGNIALQGRIELWANQTGTISLFPSGSASPAEVAQLEYRPVLDVSGLENNFVLATTDATRRRFQVSFQSSFQSGMLWSLADGQQSAPLFVMIKSSLVRTIGEKLLSALY
ncbi:unnamed protein product [Amoebophrya sp. A120]|nr:unnamed protein product [Amoebophrya sp. A120]|eukprot:GSA120T00001950001.1